MMKNRVVTRREEDDSYLQASLCAVRLLGFRSAIFRATSLAADALALASGHLESWMLI